MGTRSDYRQRARGAAPSSRKNIIRALGVLIALGVAFAVPAAAQAQPRLQNQPRIQAEAIAGKPYGVGVISIQTPLGQRMADGADGQVVLVERSGRAFFAAAEERPGGQLVRNLIGSRRRITVYFLFTGDAPLDLTLYTPAPIRQAVTPRAGNVQQLLPLWWREFTRSDPADLYPQFHNYLANTIARRMGMPLPRAGGLAALAGGFSGQLSLLAGGENSRKIIAEQILLAGGDVDEPLDVELAGPPPAAAAAEEVAPAGQVAPGGQLPSVEPIALRVPEECMYVRAGSFANFLWFQHRLDAWGGDVRNLISEQAVDYGLNDRFQRQIGLKESALAPVVGPAVIADVAIIGTDTFQRDGAAMGILFQARNNLLLGTDLQRQRNEALKATNGAGEEKLTIAGRQVSFISTPDNQLRSYYVVDGDFHLVSTSRSIVERFLETGAQGKDQPAGRGSLGASAEFRLARVNLPLEHDDTVFVYLPRAFFRNLMSPHYQIEMLRRLRSSVEMELVELAQLLARSEGRPAESIDQLVAAGTLPGWFGRRSDGSRLTLEGGQAVDSLRGVRGGFIPIPDMPRSKYTGSEAQAYEKTMAAAAESWGDLDPVFVGIHRSESQRPGLEHLSVDVQAAPLGAQNYAKLAKWLGPATDQRLAPVAGSLVDVQASLRGGSLAQTGDNYMFFGLQDSISADLGGSDRPLAGVVKMITGQSPLRGYLARGRSRACWRWYPLVLSRSPTRRVFRVRSPASGGACSTSSPCFRSTARCWNKSRRNCISNLRQIPPNCGLTWSICKARTWLAG